MPSQDAEWPAWLEAASGRVLQCNIEIAQEKKKAKGARIRILQQKIRLAEVQLQKDPEDEPTREILSVAQGHVADSLQEKVARRHELSSASWFKYGDTCSKRFFDFHRIGRKHTPLKELKTEGGDITGQEDLAHYVRSFYERLYTSKVSTLGTSEVREVSWDSTLARVSTVAVATLTWPSVGVKPNTWKSWGLGVLRDSRMLRVRQQDPKHLALRCSWCHWKGLEA
jgi:hypothetical protein